VKTFTPAANKNPMIRFCVLAYSPGDAAEGPSPDDRDILLLIENTSGAVLLINPDWQELIRAADVEYLGALLTDFRHRAKLDARRLFEQASELNVGPLLTRDAGVAKRDDPRIAQLMARFVPLGAELDKGRLPSS